MTTSYTTKYPIPNDYEEQRLKYMSSHSSGPGPLAVFFRRMPKYSEKYGSFNAQVGRRCVQPNPGRGTHRRLGCVAAYRRLQGSTNG